MNKCETCRFWEREKIEESYSRMGLGECTTTKMFWDSTTWSNTAESRVFMAGSKNSTAFVQDGSGYYAKLLTKPNHGCAMHQPLQPNA